CHSTGAKPTVTLTGPTSVTSGSTNTYTLTVGGSGNAGLDVASTIGTFIAGTGTRVLNGEITHSAPSASHSWTFTWTAPTVSTNTGATLYGAAIDSYSGGTGTTTLTATVMAPAPPPPTKPNLTASPSSLAFSYTMGGASPTAKTISVGSSGSAISYTVASSGSWLSATGGGNTPGNVNVSVNPANMAAGTYNGTVSISASGASHSPMKVAVTLTVTSTTPPPPTTGGTLSVSPSRLVFYAEGTDMPSPQ